MIICCIGNMGLRLAASPASRSCAASPILIPLTSSLYVPGKLTDLENVIVDVGTGYFVSKVRPTALYHRPPLSSPPVSLLCSIFLLSPSICLVGHLDRICSLLSHADIFLSIACFPCLPAPVQTRTEALKHYTAKTAFVRANLETLQATIEKKQMNNEMVVNLLQQKATQA